MRRFSVWTSRIIVIQLRPNPGNPFADIDLCLKVCLGKICNELQLEVLI